MFPFDSLSFHYKRWRRLRDGEAGLPRAPAEERRSIAAFRDAFRRIPVNHLGGLSTTWADRAEAMNRLRELALHADPRAFQRWDVIAARMAHTDSPATPIELAALRRDAEWSSRWEPALREHPAGRPVPYDEFPESSETLIQTVHHILRLEQLSGRPVSNWRVIVEFGGGFGGMCRAMHALGFRGRYMIYDLAPIVLLQRYYLEAVGLMTAGDERVRATSDLAELEVFAKSIRSDEPAVFLATWSLSETPITLRDQIKPIVERIGNYFLAYQGRYGDVDNVDYFSGHWIGGASRRERIPHRPDDFYAVNLASRDVHTS